MRGKSWHHRLLSFCLAIRTLVCVLFCAIPTHITFWKCFCILYLYNHSPVCTRNGKRKWTETLESHVRQPFTFKTGATVPISSEPIDIFRLLFTDYLLDDIVHQTNLYAAQVMDEHQVVKWVEVTIEEILAYFGFCILMGIVKLPSINDYWKTDPYLHYDPIALRITHDRFREIRRYMHFVDNDTLPPPGTPGSDR